MEGILDDNINSRMMPLKRSHFPLDILDMKLKNLVPWNKFSCALTPLCNPRNYR